MGAITAEIKEKNYALFINKLQKLGIDTEQLDKELGEKIKNATYSTDNKYTQTAYDGALIDTILKTFTVFAVKINDMLPSKQQVNTQTLVKVCLLHQLSKAITFIPNDNEWERNNRNILYKFAPTNAALKMGLKSLLLCQKYGITFTDEEAEAMTILDRDGEDAQAKYFASPLASLIKQANDLTYLVKRND